MNKDEFLMAIKLMSGKDILDKKFLSLNDGSSFDIDYFAETGMVLSSWQKYDGLRRTDIFSYDYLLDKITLNNDVTIVTGGSGYTSTPAITYEQK